MAVCFASISCSQLQGSNINRRHRSCGKLTAQSCSPRSSSSLGSPGSKFIARRWRIAVVGDEKAVFLAPPAEVSAAADTPLLRIWLPVGVVLGILMLIDAAYSGDWSRIGAITKEQELELQHLVPVALGGHALCAAAAGAISAKRGENWAPRAAKTMAAGFVGLAEVILLPEDSKSS